MWKTGQQYSLKLVLSFIYIYVIWAPMKVEGAGGKGMNLNKSGEKLQGRSGRGEQTDTWGAIPVKSNLYGNTYVRIQQILRRAINDPDMIRDIIKLMLSIYDHTSFGRVLRKVSLAKDCPKNNTNGSHKKGKTRVAIKKKLMNASVDSNKTFYTNEGVTEMIFSSNEDDDEGEEYLISAEKIKDIKGILG
nr:uncharacterized protein LOC121130286 isoform X2 [Lepeophtheirus salmonis]